MPNDWRNDAQAKDCLFQSFDTRLNDGLRHTGLVQDEKTGRFVLDRLHPDVFHAPTSAEAVEHLDLGCCRLELPKT